MAQQPLKTTELVPSVPRSNGITPQLPNRHLATLPPAMKNQIDSINEKYNSTWRTIEREAIRDGWSDEIIISIWDHFLLEAAKTYLPQGAQVVRLHAEEMWDRFLFPGKAFPELQGKRDDEKVREKDISRSPPSPSPPRRSEKEKEKDLRSPPRSRTLPRTQARYDPYRQSYGPRERSRGGEARHINNVNGRRGEVLEARYGARHDRIDRYRSRRSRSPRGRRQEGQYERYRT